MKQRDNELRICLEIAGKAEMLLLIIDAINSYNEQYEGDKVTYQFKPTYWKEEGGKLVVATEVLWLECNAIDLLWLGRRWERIGQRSARIIPLICTQPHQCAISPGGEPPLPEQTGLVLILYPKLTGTPYSL